MLCAHTHVLRREVDFSSNVTWVFPIRIIFAATHDFGLSQNASKNGATNSR
jgi:hypothetical protein